jgi:hypothetical protein
MLADLITQERMNCRPRLAVRRRDYYAASVRRIFVLISNQASLRPESRHARWCFPMRCERRAEVAFPEVARDGRKMDADSSYSARIQRVVVCHVDPPTIRREGEVMRRRVLIKAHGCLTALFGVGVLLNRG